MSVAFTYDDAGSTVDVGGEVAQAADARRDMLQKLVVHAKAYQGADHTYSLIQFATTLIGYLALMALVIATQKAGYWPVSVALMLPASGFLVRLFIIQHDCGHGSFFNKRQYNSAVGRIISVLTVTPYDFWRRSHNLHHSHSGNLDKRTMGAIDTLTVDEYKALTPRNKLLYRLFRNPALLLLGLAPFSTLIMQRFPPLGTPPYLTNYQSVGRMEVLPSIMGLNVAILVVYGLMAYTLGWQSVVFGVLPVIYLTSVLGGWLFYIQHQFEHTFWQHNNKWSYNEAALYSSSQYILPPLFQWFSGSIGLHHLHHFNAKIPNYKLQDCVSASPELTAMNRMTFTESLKCLRWALWDEKQQKLIAFKDLKSA